MCGGGVRSILLLPRVARSLETIDVCLYQKYIITTHCVNRGCVALTLISKFRVI